MAFSVENILDPNKFCGKKSNANLHWMNGFESDERDHIEDESDQSGELRHNIFINGYITKLCSLNDNNDNNNSILLHTFVYVCVC